MNDELQVKLLEASPAANVTLLLALCGDLESVIDSYACEDLARGLKDVISLAIRPGQQPCSRPSSSVPLSPLSRLTRINLDSSILSFGLQDILALQFFPALRHISVRSLADEERSTTGPGRPPLRPSGAARPAHAAPFHLHLFVCRLSGAGFSRLLRSYVSRHWKLTVRWDRGYHPTNLTDSAVGRSLREPGADVAGPTLDTTRRDHTLRTCHPDSFGPFSSLPSLTTLAAPSHAFNNTFRRRGEGGPGTIPGNIYSDLSHLLHLSMGRLVILGVTQDEVPRRVVEQILASPAVSRLNAVIQLPWFNWEECVREVRQTKPSDCGLLQLRRGIDLGLEIMDRR